MSESLSRFRGRSRARLGSGIGVPFVRSKQPLQLICIAHVRKCTRNPLSYDISKYIAALLSVWPINPIKSIFGYPAFVIRSERDFAIITQLDNRTLFAPTYVILYGAVTSATIHCLLFYFEFFNNSYLRILYFNNSLMC